MNHFRRPGTRAYRVALPLFSIMVTGCAAVGGPTARSGSGIPDELRRGIAEVGRLRKAEKHDEAIATGEPLLPQTQGFADARGQLLTDLAHAYVQRAGRRAESPASGDTWREDLEAARGHLEAALGDPAAGAGLSPGRMAEQSVLLAVVHQRLSQPRKALEPLLEADRILAGQSRAGAAADRSMVFANLIAVQTELGDFAAVDQQIEALRNWPVGQGEPAVRNALGIGLMSLGRFQEAVTEFNLARTLAHRAGRQALLVEITANSAACAQQLGRYQEAEQYLKDTLTLVDSGAGDRRARLTIQANLGRMYLALFRLAEAEEELQSVRAGQEQLFGPDAPDTLRTEVELAIVAQARGEYRVARERATRAVSGLHAVMGDGHPQVAEARLVLASILADSDECDPALRESDMAVTALDEALGRNHLQAIRGSLRRLQVAAVCREAEGGAAAFSSATLDARPRVDAAQALYGESHFAVLEAVILITDVMARDLRAAPQALAQYQAAAEGLSRTFDKCHPSMVQLTAGQARLHKHMQQWEEVERLCSDGLRCDGDWMERHPSRAHLLELLGDVRAAQGKEEEATQLYRQAYNLLLGTYGSEHKEVRAFAQRHRR